MKKYVYKVVYENGNEEEFTANGFQEAIIRAMAYAYEKAWDWRIKYVSDEKGNCIKDIQPITFTYSK